MFYWQGHGYVVAIIGFGMAVATEIISEEIMQNDKYYQENTWLITLAACLAGAFTAIFARYIDERSKRKARILIDKETGEEVIFHKKHSLLFIPIKWWSFIYIILGIMLGIHE